MSDNANLIDNVPIPAGLFDGLSNVQVGRIYAYANQCAARFKESSDALRAERDALRAHREAQAGWLAQYVIDHMGGTNDLPAWVKRSADYYVEALASAERAEAVAAKLARESLQRTLLLKNLLNFAGHVLTSPHFKESDRLWITAGFLEETYPDEHGNYINSRLTELGKIAVAEAEANPIVWLA